MNTRKHLVITILVISVALVFGCTKKGPEKKEKQKNDISMHTSDTNGDVGFVPVLKKQKLANYPSDTIGNAFDSYVHLVKKEWKEKPVATGQISIDFVGWLASGTLNDDDVKSGVTAKGIDVTFVVEPNGTYYVLMISKLEAKSDGTVYSAPYNDISRILKSIYSNKKINL
jgi:hypothetical protein